MGGLIYDDRTTTDDIRKRSVIAWEKMSGTWSATSEKADFGVALLDNVSTDDMWLADNVTQADAKLDLGEEKTVEHVFLLIAEADTFEVAYSTDDSTYTDITSSPQTAERNALVLFDAVTARYIRIRLNASSAADLGLAVVYVGRPLVMQRQVFGGLEPPSLARDDKIRPQISEGGQWLGSTVQRKGFSFSLEWRHLEYQWFQSNMQPFAEKTRGVPFPIAWRPEPGTPSENDVLLAIATDNIVPSTMSIRDYVSVSISMRGFGE